MSQQTVPQCTGRAIPTLTDICVDLRTPKDPRRILAARASRGFRRSGSLLKRLVTPQPMAMSSGLMLVVLRSLACAVAQDVTWDTSTGYAPAFAPAPAAAQFVPYQNNLNPIVAPSTLSDNGTDWCKPFKPCNSTAGASTKSSYNLGLTLTGSSVQASAFR